MKRCKICDMIIPNERLKGNTKTCSLDCAKINLKNKLYKHAHTEKGKISRYNSKKKHREKIKITVRAAKELGILQQKEKETSQNDEAIKWRKRFTKHKEKIRNYRKNYYNKSKEKLNEQRRINYYNGKRSPQILQYKALKELGLTDGVNND